MTRTLADFLKNTLVTKRGKTVTEVARELDLSRPSFSHVINGHADLSIALAVKIQKRFGIPARGLLMEQLDEKLSALKKP
jgi:plasmid maintenance system antidote protein VapI